MGRGFRTRFVHSGSPRAVVTTWRGTDRSAVGWIPWCTHVGGLPAALATWGATCAGGWSTSAVFVAAVGAMLASSAGLVREERTESHRHVAGRVVGGTRRTAQRLKPATGGASTFRQPTVPRPIRARSSGTADGSESKAPRQDSNLRPLAPEAFGAGHSRDEWGVVVARAGILLSAFPATSAVRLPLVFHRHRWLDVTA
jgi:hypothetical protein